MTEESTSTPLNNSLPPKTPIGQIQANTDYCLAIIKALESETPEQYDTKENAKAALTLFQEHQLQELRKAYES